MLKMALLDCAINEKCCSVNRGRGIWQLKSPYRRGGGGGGKDGAAGIDWRTRSIVSCSVQKKCLQRFVVIKSDANYQALKNWENFPTRNRNFIIGTYSCKGKFA